MLTGLILIPELLVQLRQGTMQAHGERAVVGQLERLLEEGLRFAP